MLIFGYFLFKHAEEKLLSLAICSNMDGPREYYAYGNVRQKKTNTK